MERKKELLKGNDNCFSKAIELHFRYRQGVFALFLYSRHSRATMLLICSKLKESCIIELPLVGDLGGYL
ncbi:hypothetical protein Ancab_005628 [Ancistrocladus abbreviatus]